MDTKFGNLQLQSKSPKNVKNDKDRRNKSSSYNKQILNFGIFILNVLEIASK